MRVFYFLFFTLYYLPLSSQTNDVNWPYNEQLKISYSLEYDELPLKMRMFKKMLPKKSTVFYSQLGSRKELNINTKIMGRPISSSTIIIENYTDSIISIKVSGIAGDSLIEEIINKPKIQNTSKLLLGNEEKEILGYNCISFLIDNDSTSTKGFLATKINGVNEYHGYGMPLEYQTVDKSTKLISLVKATAILFEPLKVEYFDIDIE